MEPLQDEAPRILVVDDERVIREILSDFLMMEGMVVRTAENGEAAIAELQKRPYNLVISDLKMPKMGGLELLGNINDLNLNLLTVIMTGFGTVETAIEAMKNGAYDYVLKPFKVEEVVHIVERGLERQRLQMENMRLKEALSLYKISEAMSQSLSLDHVLEIILDASLEELHADLVTLLFPGDIPGTFVERIRRGAKGTSAMRPEQLNTEELLRCFDHDLPVLAHGTKALRFVSSPADSPRIVSFCALPLTVHHQVLGMMIACSFSRGHKFSEGQRKMLSVLGSRAAVSIENAKLYQNLLQSNRGLEVANLRLEENFRQTIVGFVTALEENDKYTRGHSERVSVYTRMIAEAMGLPENEVERVALSAKIHDIGKIGIPTEKLNKVGRLTAEETALFRTHPEKGRRILEPIPFLRDLVPGAYCHHENFDGTGYPQGLRGEEIPLFGRIISVADAYDAMTSDRAYRKAMPVAEVIAEMRSCSGAQFDPEIVKAFLTAIQRNRQQTAAVQISFPAIAAAGPAA